MLTFCFFSSMVTVLALAPLHRCDGLKRLLQERWTLMEVGSLMYWLERSSRYSLSKSVARLTCSNTMNTRDAYIHTNDHQGRLEL